MEFLYSTCVVVAVVVVAAMMMITRTRPRYTHVCGDENARTERDSALNEKLLESCMVGESQRDGHRWSSAHLKDAGGAGDGSFISKHSVSC